MFVLGVLNGGAAIQEISATKDSSSPRDDESLTTGTNWLPADAKMPDPGGVGFFDELSMFLVSN